MIDYIIAALLSIIVLLIGYYLARITKEELTGFFGIFNYSLTIFTSSIIFMVMFFFGIELIIIYSLVIIFAIPHLFSILLGRIGISLLVYFFSSFFLVIYFNPFLLALTIILGFLIASIDYQVRHKENISE